jgi:hypothetical protein
LRNATLFTTLVVAGIGSIVYILLNSPQIDFIVAIVIITAAVITIFWNASTFRILWVYKLRNIQFTLVLFNVLCIVLIWSTAAAYTGITPFSYAKEVIGEKLSSPSPESAIVQDPSLQITPGPSPSAVPTYTPSCTPTSTTTPAPSPTPTVTQDPVMAAYSVLEIRYLEESNSTIPISLDSFVLLAQSLGIEGAAKYVTSGRWDSRYPL